MVMRSWVLDWLQLVLGRTRGIPKLLEVVRFETSEAVQRRPAVEGRNTANPQNVTAQILQLAAFLSSWAAVAMRGPLASCRTDSAAASAPASCRAARAAPATRAAPRARLNSHPPRSTRTDPGSVARRRPSGRKRR
eukprot:5198737-Pleurochrysis_carterae.AAC.2